MNETKKDDKGAKAVSGKAKLERKKPVLTASDIVELGRAAPRETMPEDAGDSSGGSATAKPERTSK